MGLRPGLVAAALAALTEIVAPRASAQMPPEMQRQLQRIGPPASPQAANAVLQLYGHEVRKTGRAGINVVLDARYGSLDLQTLDLYQPAGGKTGAPVVLFVHGGGFVAGDKNINPDLFSNVPAYFGRNGLLGATMNYRLVPAARWPAGAQDVGAAVAWLRGNAAKYGGDPARIFLFGYSSGATHVASYVLDRAQQPAEGSGVAGAVLLSGLYQVQPPGVKQLADNVAGYFGTDASQFEARSPLTHAAGSSVPVLLARAQHDPWFLTRTTDDLREALCRRASNCPRLVVLPHHNHLSTAAAFNTADEELGREILAFIEGRR